MVFEDVWFELVKAISDLESGDLCEQLEKMFANLVGSSSSSYSSNSSSSFGVAAGPTKGLVKTKYGK